MRTTTLVILVLAAGIAALALLPGGGASAHALLVRSDPSVNARLLDPPKRVTADFSESLASGLSSLRVLDGTGQGVDSGDVTFNAANEREMSVGLKEGLAPGFYTVVWETLSAVDGHLLKGSFPFTILNSDGSEPTGPRFTGISAGVSGGEPTAESVATKWLIITASVLLVGGLAFAIWVVRPAT